VVRFVDRSNELNVPSNAINSKGSFTLDSLAPQLNASGVNEP